MAEVSDMSELEAENSRLRAETERLKADLAQARKNELDTGESGRAMLFMLEDLEKSREAIERSKEKWEATFDSISDPLFIHDKEMMLVMANSAYLTASGEAKFGHIIGKPYYEVFPKAAGPLPSCQRSMVKEEAEEAEELKVGDVIYLSRAFPIHDVQGVYLYSVHTLEDITERKRVEAQLKNSEERHRQIIQTSMDGFWITDTKGRILDVNDAYCQLIGYPREELLNMRIQDVEAKESQEETAQHIQEIITKGYARFETRHRRKDGQLLNIEVSVVHQPDKEDGHFFIFLRDITERKRAEAKINEQLNELNRWYEATLGRETRTLGLKREVNELLTQAGQPPRYHYSAESDGTIS